MAKRRCDIIGRRFGKLLVIRDSGLRKYNPSKVLWTCKCDCGVECNALGISMLRGITKSCGCGRIKNSKNNPKLKHGSKSHNVIFWQNTLDLFLPDEVWLNIPGLEGLYQASSLGRIKSLAKYIRKDAILKQGFNRKGYLNVSVTRNGEVGKNYTVHRLVAKSFHLNPENKPQVNHKDCDKCNNLPQNLEWATNKENRLHWLNWKREQLLQVKQ